MSQDSVVWHPHILSADLLQTLVALEQASLLLPFYLGGGTGLALQLGHRRSQDLDFFAFDSFDPEALLLKLERLGGLSVMAKSPQTLHVEFRRAKVSLAEHEISSGASARKRRQFGLAPFRGIDQHPIEALLELIQDQRPNIHLGLN